MTVGSQNFCTFVIKKAYRQKLSFLRLSQDFKGISFKLFHFQACILALILQLEKGWSSKAPILKAVLC